MRSEDVIAVVVVIRICIVSIILVGKIIKIMINIIIVIGSPPQAYYRCHRERHCIVSVLMCFSLSPSFSCYSVVVVLVALILVVVITSSAIIPIFTDSINISIEPHRHTILTVMLKVVLTYPLPLNLFFVLIIAF